MFHAMYPSFILSKEKQVLYGFSKEPRKLKSKHCRGHEFAVLDRMDRQSGNAYGICERLLCYVVMVETAAFQIVMESQ